MTAGPTDNSGVLATYVMEPTLPAPNWAVASAYAAKSARALTSDPARPLQTLEFADVLPAPKQDRFSKTELNNLNGVGWTVGTVSPDNKPQILRESTRYQKNLYGQPDDAYEVVTTLATLAALFRRQKQIITSKFPRHKLANDGTRFGPGQAIVTPKIVKAELVSQYEDDMYRGLVENMAAFKAALIVERDTDDVNRLNILYPPDLINQLRIFAVLAQFCLQYSRGEEAAA